MNGDTAAAEAPNQQQIYAKAREHNPQLQESMRRIANTGIVTLSDGETIGRDIIRGASTIAAPGHRLGDVSPERDCVHMGNISGITWLNRPVSDTVVGQGRRDHFRNN